MAEKAKIVKRNLKNQNIAALLSAIWPGFGQIYLNQLKKGLLLLVLQAMFVGAAAALYVPNPLSKRLICCACGVLPLTLATWLFGMYDAYICAARINKGEKSKDLFE